MKNFVVTLFLAVVNVTIMFAIPAEPKIDNHIQPDGTQLSVILCGDEYMGYYTTIDGVPLAKESNNSFYIAEWDDTQLVPTKILAHNPQLREEEERDYIEANSQNTIEQISLYRAMKQGFANQLRTKKTKMLRENIQPSEKSLLKSSTSPTKGLIILVNFPDRSFLSSSTNAEISAMMNEEGYNRNGHIGSLRDYFYDQSSGRLDITFDVVGPVTVSKNMSYYGADQGSTHDSHVGEMVAEACNLVDGYVNFADYDWYDDGEVEQVYVIYAGYSQASGAPSYTIWPKEWYLSYSDYGRYITLDGVIIDTFACSSELDGTSGSTIDGIGTACHEFSHCMGLPDLYDTSDNGTYGMGTWSVMDMGCYNSNGRIPCNYTAFERNYAGWMPSSQLQVLKEPVSITQMPSLSDDDAMAYRIYNDGSVYKEYFILENRQQKGWDVGCSAHGLLITHIDYDADAWGYNNVNNDPSHRRYTIKPADNDLSYSSEAGDTYPGIYGKSSFTDTSSPAALFYQPTKSGSYYLGKPITNISESNGKISFDFMGGTSGGEESEEVELSRDGWSARADGYAASMYDGPPRYAFDGDLNSHWHSRYDDSGGGSTNYELPHYIQFDLGSVQEFSAFNYVSRTANGSQNGDIANYEIYISNSDMTYSLGSGYVPTTGTKIKSGTFTYNNSREHYVLLGGNFSARYLLLLCKSTANGTKFSACSEFYLYNTPSSGTEEGEYCTPSVTTQGTATSYVGQIVTLSTTGAAVNALWNNPKTENYNGAVQPIENTFTAYPGQTITLNISDKNTVWGLVRVYVDLNGNYLFDLDEQIFADADRNRTTQISQTFTLSPDIPEGKYLMRVMYVAGSNEKNLWACDDYTEGGYYDFEFTVETDETAITSHQTAKTKVYVTDGTIVVETSTKSIEPISVYNVAGTLLAQSYTRGSVTKLQVSQSGLFIVKVGGEVYRVVK